jgi:hypothetical protein
VTGEHHEELAALARLADDLGDATADHGIRDPRTSRPT